MTIRKNEKICKSCVVAGAILGASAGAYLFFQKHGLDGSCLGGVIGTIVGLMAESATYSKKPKHGTFTNISRRAAHLVGCVSAGALLGYFIGGALFTVAGAMAGVLAVAPVGYGVQSAVQYFQDRKKQTEPTVAAAPKKDANARQVKCC